MLLPWRLGIAEPVMPCPTGATGYDPSRMCRRTGGEHQAAGVGRHQHGEGGLGLRHVKPFVNVGPWQDNTSTRSSNHGELVPFLRQ